jgi:hypothetical protein
MNMPRAQQLFFVLPRSRWLTGAGLFRHPSKKIPDAAPNPANSAYSKQYRKFIAIIYYYYSDEIGSLALLAGAF